MDNDMHENNRPTLSDNEEEKMAKLDHPTAGRRLQDYLERTGALRRAHVSRDQALSIQELSTQSEGPTRASVAARAQRLEDDRPAPEQPQVSLPPGPAPVILAGNYYGLTHASDGRDVRGWAPSGDGEKVERRLDDTTEHEKAALSYRYFPRHHTIELGGYSNEFPRFQEAGILRVSKLREGAVEVNGEAQWAVGHHQVQITVGNRSQAPSGARIDLWSDQGWRPLGDLEKGITLDHQPGEPLTRSAFATVRQMLLDRAAWVLSGR